LATYENDLRIGTGRYARSYVRRAGELAVRFKTGLTPGEITTFWQANNLQPRHSETPQRHEAFEAGGMRWFTRPGPEGDPREYVRLTMENPDNVDKAEALTPVYQPVDGDEGDAVTPLPDEFLVRIGSAHLSEASADLAALDLEHQADVILGDDWHLFRLAPSRLRDDGFDVIEAARAVPGVRDIEHDWLKIETHHTAFPVGPPDDEHWPGQWNLARLGMETAWKLTAGKPGVAVAVIDSGFDLNHPDLAFDPDPRRHLDVEALWSGSPNISGAGPSDFPHGTPVAGIVGARTNNAGGVAGQGGVASVAGACGIVPIRLGPLPTSGRVAAGLQWARAKDVRVVNLSLTTVETSALIAQIELCASAGMVLCAAAGNAAPGLGAELVGFPARHRSVIAVGASDKDDLRKIPKSEDGEQWQSRYGRGLDVIAPGVKLWSTDEQGPAGWNDGQTNLIPWFGVLKSPGDPAGDYIAPFGGTSGATPHVSGLAALLLAAHPNLTGAQVRHIIERTCAKNGYYPFAPHPERTGSALTWHREVGCGRIDAAAALKNAPVIAVEPIPAFLPDLDPSDLEDCVVFAGYLGRGNGSLWRIYATTTFDAWVEVEKADIRETEPIVGGAGGTRVWVRRAAHIRRVVTEDVTAAPR